MSSFRDQRCLYVIDAYVDWSSSDRTRRLTPPRTGTPQVLGAERPALHLLLCRVVLFDTSALRHP
jgi:hypothetical protein